MHLTFDEYWTCAKKMISKHGYSFMGRDDLIISKIVDYMIKADNSYNGMGTRDGWRTKQAWYAIQHLKRKHYLNRNKKFFSITQQFDIEDKKRSTKLKEQYEDLIEVAQKVLSSRQFDCLVFYYQHGYTLQEIGDKFDLTKERIRQILKIAVEKVRLCMLQQN